jgi:hypothetical protein
MIRLSGRERHLLPEIMVQMRQAFFRDYWEWFPET